MTENTNILWDWGTGYDLFVSLFLLHEPEFLGLRPSWAAGVRSRLPAAERETLEQAQWVVRFPLGWVYDLPASKDGAGVLAALGKMAPGERIPLLAAASQAPQDALRLLADVAMRGRWSPDDQDQLWAMYKTQNWHPPKKALASILDMWVDLEAFGQRYLSALQAYQHVFFREEEQRIAATLAARNVEVQQQAAGLDLNALIERVSRGIRFEDGLDVADLVMVPSYWITPLVVFRREGELRGVFLYGARPDADSLVPGAQVPDAMLRTLKTLADPTRLRILRFLSQEQMSPAELSRRLRLRAPTVTHHLNALRLAGLVYLSVDDNRRKFYATRSEALADTFAALEVFLGENEGTKK